MKKTIILLISLLFILFGCSDNNRHNNDDFDNISIISPTGGPSLIFLNNIDNPNFETNSNPKNIISKMTKNSDKDVIVLDTVSGIKAINNGSPYKLAFNITFGNYYLVATGNDDNNLLDNNDYVVVFGDTGSILFDYIYDDVLVNKEIVNSVSDAAKCLALMKNLETGNDIDYVLVSEPVLTNVLNNKGVSSYGKAYIYSDIQKLYKTKSNKELVQASIFIKENCLIDYNNFTNYIENNINNLLNNKEYLDNILSSYDEEFIKLTFGLSIDSIYNCLKNNSINLGFKKAIDNKNNIDFFLSLQNIEETNEEIYYK